MDVSKRTCVKGLLASVMVEMNVVCWRATQDDDGDGGCFFLLVASVVDDVLLLVGWVCVW